MQASTTLHAALAVAALAWGCERPPGPGAGPLPCTIATRVATLPSRLRETSGLAASRRHPGVLWTHNDSGGEPILYALNEAGYVLAAVRVTGARNVDWEDIAVGPCTSGDCIFIADIGDNAAARRTVEVYRVPEPRLGDSRSALAERLVLTYPDGPRDAEALYVLPDASIHIVSKGRKSPVAVYGLPSGAHPGVPIQLTRSQVLSPNGSEIGGLVTGADATPDGRFVAIRTYRVVRLYRAGPDGHLTPVTAADSAAPLQGAREAQGEGIAFGRGDTIWLSSEAGALGSHASLSRIRCRLPA